ncbi:Alpha-xylosidase [Arcticibacter svalbardensis MN12-7]|uniref:Alpha-xylosidase n=1 Tax=Arcticibacter svalbardensis MN12-7 TaxID=1150600 RepID=R9GSR2_9SPHI|nr:Alpha-xylosidase [Arcticibacter svalbardensis MN12-7]
MAGCKVKSLLKYEKSDNTVTIHVDSSILQVQIIDHYIIHIKKVLDNSVASKIPDYVTVLSPQKTPWQVAEKNGQVIISTDSVKVIVNANGNIQYQNQKDNKLLSETKDYTYINPKNQGNKVSQSFAVGDEAIYGLV